MKISLNDNWQLTQLAGQESYPFSIPGDVHSTLAGNGVIDNPYYRSNELTVDWVNQTQWVIARQFHVDTDSIHLVQTLELDQVDCIASVFVNNKLAGNTNSQFIRYAFDISELIVAGENSLRIEFDIARDVAEQKAERFPFELPYSDNCRIAHNNLLRKTACHAGWDWNICLMPTGVYGGVYLHQNDSHRIDSIKIEQSFLENDVSVLLTAYVEAHSRSLVSCVVSLCGQSNVVEFQLEQGVNTIQLPITIANAERWWPVGLGPQTQHSLSVDIGGQVQSQLLGLRDAKLLREPDTPDSHPDNGSGFAFSINGTKLFMRGANWIPADALPQKATPAVVRELLESAIAVNMNMLRVWGGGQYEADWFYELCDELGILVWQDFMFSCAHYPASDSHWLSLVRTEATQQVRRLSRFASVVLWCGDNELVGALKWWEVTLNNRDRYLANYIRLNHCLQQVIEKELPQSVFWPSSPALGFNNYDDGWKNDTAGDMHFWDVWHEAKPFSAYQEIHPRFCSEFGFQSFPSKPVVETFAEIGDQNVSSDVMEIHQRNKGGNARIVETLVRYFSFPESFDQMLFLSQVQQAMAIKTAVEYWRMAKPHCMGTLYWQLNDTWPVASWSSLEYGGGWKLLHYAARKFYQNLHVAVVPGHTKFGTEGELLLKIVSDLASSENLNLVLRAMSIEGIEQARWAYQVQATANEVTTVQSFQATDIPGNCYLRIEWQVEGIAELYINEYWPSPYKNFAIPHATINTEVCTIDNKTAIKLHSDAAAYCVTLNLGGRDVFSDNGFTLLPNETKILYLSKALTNTAIPELDDLVVNHL